MLFDGTETLVVGTQKRRNDLVQSGAVRLC